ncbi:MAG: helix-turn-helix transcriptional regulator, partial [Actinobacteria bacterium]|nr:helix-turn-helix transcriptional regulator [Actinomycetota bacterium]
MEDSHALDLADIAASSGSLAERAQWMIERLRRVTPFDAAWVALADPLDGPYRSLVALDLDDTVHRYLAG